MSLWTPDGEHPVDRNAPADNKAAPAASEAMAGMPEFDQLSPEQQVEAQQMAEEMAAARQQIAEAPASTVVANHAMGLYELPEAAVAIDGMGALLEALKGRLGENEAVLTQAIQQLRLAYVELSKPPETADES
ncbi:MAG: hypothetical protein ACKVKO_09370 [Acidimicrobiales bacterium]